MTPISALDGEVRATWHCLCLDVNGPEVVEFWANALRLTHKPGNDPDDPGALFGPEGLLMELEPVAEPKLTKHRVHFDLHVSSVEELTGLGATTVLPAERSGFHWTVLEDPEGGELCAFVHDEPPAHRLHDVIVDSAQPEAIARWWADVFGVEAGTDGTDWGVGQVLGMPFENLVFNPVPEPKTVKNRIHWDIRGDVAELERAGAKVLAERAPSLVMADPEGNEFCVLPPE